VAVSSVQFALLVPSAQCGSRGIEIPLQGGISALGEYFCEVELGSPSQRVRLQVDTGSASFVVTAKECETCERNGVVGGAYAYHESSSANKVGCDSSACGSNTCSSATCDSDVCSEKSNACCSPHDPDACGFFLQYGGDTNYHVAAQGDLVLEKLVLGNRTFSNMTVYRTMHQGGPWPSSVDGIFGLGLPALSCNPTCSKPVYEQIIEEQELPKVFSMCFGDTTGMLVLGSNGKAEGLHSGGVHYVPILQSQMFGTYYKIALTQMFVGATLLDDSKLAFPREAIVDSGTTLLLLEDRLWTSLVAMFQTHYCHLQGVCDTSNVFEAGVCLTSPPKGFPKLSLSFTGGLRLELPPSLYFVKYDDPVFLRKVYCMGIQPAGGERTVIGDTLLRGFVTVHDLEKMRVGFALPNPDVCGNVASMTPARLRSKPYFLSEVKNSSQAFALTLGTVVAFAAGLAQLILCARATRGLAPKRPNPINESSAQEEREGMLGEISRGGFGTFSTTQPQ